MSKEKYEIKEVFEQGCTEIYIFKNGKKLRIIRKDDWGHICSPMAIIELLVKELNDNAIS